MLVSNGHNSIHLADATVERNRDDSLCVRCYGCLQGVRIHVVIVSDFYQNRLCTHVHNSGDRSYKGVCDGNYLVARSNASGLERELKGVITAVESHGVFDTDKRSEVSLKIP